MGWAAIQNVDRKSLFLVLLYCLLGWKNHAEHMCSTKALSIFGGTSLVYKYVLSYWNLPLTYETINMTCI